jgi:hypothetical protein
MSQRSASNACTAHIAYRPYSVEPTSSAALNLSSDAIPHRPQSHNNLERTEAKAEGRAVSEH